MTNYEEGSFNFLYNAGLTKFIGLAVGILAQWIFYLSTIKGLSVDAFLIYSPVSQFIGIITTIVFLIFLYVGFNALDVKNFDVEKSKRLSMASLILAISLILNTIFYAILLFVGYEPFIYIYAVFSIICGFLYLYVFQMLSNFVKTYERKATNKILNVFYQIIAYSLMIGSVFLGITFFVVETEVLYSILLYTSNAANSVGSISFIVVAISMIVYTKKLNIESSDMIVRGRITDLSDVPYTCTSCGNSITKDSKFCSSCGSKIVK